MKIWVLVLFRIPLKVRAMWAIGAWIIFQAASAYFSDATDETAWFAHIGGLAVGAILVLVLKRPDAALFDRASLPLAAEEIAPQSDVEPDTALTAIGRVTSFRAK